DVPMIQIVKLTNGTDNDTPPGLHVVGPSTITWTYRVTATGSNVPLSSVVVTDNKGVTPVFQSGDTNANGLLDAGETWIYQATGAAIAGQYSNIGTAVGHDSFIPATTVSATNPDNYFGDMPNIAIVKLTNGT